MHRGADGDGIFLRKMRRQPYAAFKGANDFWELGHPPDGEGKVRFGVSDRGEQTIHHLESLSG